MSDNINIDELFALSDDELDSVSGGSLSEKIGEDAYRLRQEILKIDRLPYGSWERRKLLSLMEQYKSLVAKHQAGE